MIQFSTNSYYSNDVIRLIYEEGINQDTLMRLCTPFENEDQKTYRGRLNVVVAPNIIEVVINNRIEYILSNYSFIRDDGSEISSKYISGIIKELMISGSVYLIGTDIIPCDLFILNLNHEQKEYAYKLWEKDVIRFISYDDDEFLSQTFSLFSKHLAAISAYYTMASTHDLALVISSFPMFTRKGLSTESFSLSPTTVFEFRGDGEVSWVTHDGRLLEVTEGILKNRLNSIYDSLGVLPLNGIDPSNTGAITSLISHSAQQSRFYRMAKTIANVLRVELKELTLEKIQDTMSLIKEV
jgi:hypothetical protein